MVAGLLSVVPVPAAFAGTVTAQCQVIKIGKGGDIVAHVYGNASNLTDAKKRQITMFPRGTISAIVEKLKLILLAISP